MKHLLLTLLLGMSLSAISQSPANINVYVAEDSTSESITLDPFHLNHVLYIKAFVLSDIYSTITSQEMAFIDSTLLQNLSDGRRTQFIINTGQKVPYRLSAFINLNEGKTHLILLTNYNRITAKFEKEDMKEDYYATYAEIRDSIVIGNMFELPMKNEMRYREEKDYIALINMSIFNGRVDTTEINNWFKLASETQPDKVNNFNWLKSYYYLYQREFEKSKEYLKELKKSVGNSPDGEQNHWAMFIKVLACEIETMEILAN